MKLQGCVNGGVYPVTQTPYVPEKPKVYPRPHRHSYPSVHRGKEVLCIETGIIYSSITEAARFMHVSDNTLGAAVRGKSKTCAGFHWRYME